MDCKETSEQEETRLKMFAMFYMFEEEDSVYYFDHFLKVAND